MSGSGCFLTHTPPYRQSLDTALPAPGFLYGPTLSWLWLPQQAIESEEQHESTADGDSRNPEKQFTRPGPMTGATSPR